MTKLYSKKQQELRVMLPNFNTLVVGLQNNTQNKRTLSSADTIQNCSMCRNV